jgi:hypothetical protein
MDGMMWREREEWNPYKVPYRILTPAREKA